jgi:hypothetical protein
MYWRKKYQQESGGFEKHPPLATSGFVAVHPRMGTACGNILLRGRGGVEVEVPYGTPFPLS